MNIDALGSFEKDTLLRSLLHVMPPETRRRVMEEHPVIYAKMAPHTTETVVGRVRARLDGLTTDREGYA